MSFFSQEHLCENQEILINPIKNISIAIKREDRIHPFVSGNKFRKLKYNLDYALNNRYKTVLTYGGAFSNHIAATAAAANICGLKSIGIIRGEEIKHKFSQNPSSNPTLQYAAYQGMHLHFISREDYSTKESEAEINKLQNKFGAFYRIPEGGTNQLAVKGCEEILTSIDEEYDIIACCVGTGGTISGIINSSKPTQKVLGFSALKNHPHDEINKYTAKNNYEIIEEDYFGGYGKSNDELIKFINTFYEKHYIKLDPIYTGKMMFKLYRMIEANEFFRDKNILAIHSGGIQGVKAYNNMLKSKNRPSIVFQ